MADKHSVTYYAKGTATIFVFFPNGEICCKNCEFLYNDRGLGRCKCELQHGKIIPLDCIDTLDIKCPIKFEDKE